MKNNPSNEFSRDEVATQRETPSPLQKARVVSVNDHPEEDGFHTVRVRVYGSPSEQVFTAPVLTPHKGDVTVPERGDDVAVMFGPNDKPWMIGFWYASDRVADGTLTLPDYEEGDRIIGNGSNSFMSISNDGTITIKTGGDQAIDIDRQDAIAYLSTAQSIPGDDQFYKIEFDTVEHDENDLLDLSTHDATLLHGGAYSIASTVAIPSPGQNNRYTITVYVNGVRKKRKSRQSAVNEELSLDIELNQRLSSGDVVDIRIRQNSGSSKSLNGTSETSVFNIEREGV
jgi:hypothetical protein